MLAIFVVPLWGVDKVRNQVAYKGSGTARRGVPRTIWSGHGAAVMP